MTSFRASKFPLVNVILIIGSSNIGCIVELERGGRYGITIVSLVERIINVLTIISLASTVSSKVSDSNPWLTSSRYSSSRGEVVSSTYSLACSDMFGKIVTIDKLFMSLMASVSIEM